MTDGRVYTLQDEFDVLHEDLELARRQLERLERAPYEGRSIQGEAGIVWNDAVQGARARVAFLRREIMVVETKLEAEEER